MNGKQLFELFDTLFPMYSCATDIWFCNGHNSIRIKLIGVAEEYAFTYKSSKEWKFETLKNFVFEGENRKIK